MDSPAVLLRPSPCTLNMTGLALSSDDTPVTRTGTAMLCRSPIRLVRRGMSCTLDSLEATDLSPTPQAVSVSPVSLRESCLFGDCIA